MQVNLIIGLLHELLILLLLQFAIFLRLGWEALQLIYFIILIDDFEIHLLDFFEELVEILFDIFHLLYFLPCYRLLAQQRCLNEGLLVRLGAMNTSGDYPLA